MSSSEISSKDTMSEDEVDSFNLSRDGIIYGTSDYSGRGGDSMISDPNIVSSSTSTDNCQQQQQQTISTAAGGGTDDDLMVNVSSSDASSSWFTLNNNTNMDKSRPLVEIKLENPNVFPITVKQPQLQQFHNQQQQIASISSPSAQKTIQFRASSLQISPVYLPNMGMARAPPVKVESFRELMGGKSSMKHDSEEKK